MRYTTIDIINVKNDSTEYVWYSETTDKLVVIDSWRHYCFIQYFPFSTGFIGEL